MTAQLFSPLVFLLVLFIFTTACNTPNGSRGAEAVAVEVATVGAGHESAAFSYSGAIEAGVYLPLSFPITGTVACVFVNEGDRVTRGQLLALLDTGNYAGTVSMAEASLLQAQDAYDRLLPMHRNSSIADITFIEAEATLQRTRSALSIAENNLRDCALRAPRSGIVGTRNIEVGMTATPNITTISIVDIDKVYAAVAVNEREISALRKHMPARVRIGALRDALFDGTVEEVGVIADRLSRSYTVRIGISNPGHVIKPGMVCEVFLRHDAVTESTGNASHARGYANTDIAESGRGAVIPVAAVSVDERGRHFVYVADSSSSTAHRRLIRPGALLRDGIQIHDGLREGELVVINGQHKLHDGAAIQPVGNGRWRTQ